MEGDSTRCVEVGDCPFAVPPEQLQPPDAFTRSAFSGASSSQCTTPGFSPVARKESIDRSPVSVPFLANVRDITPRERCVGVAAGTPVNVSFTWSW